MILSALLTSVGINLGLCLLFFALYSVLKNQPGNTYVYAPRLVGEGEFEPVNSFNFERLLPSTSWVRRAWEVSEEELLAISGLDAVVFMRIFIFSLRVFTIAGVLGVFILIPVNYLGNQISIDFYNLPNKSLDSFSISNVNNGSNRLWIHFGAVYIFTTAVCCLLYFEYKYISSKRIDYFYSSKPQPNQFTIMVRSIPGASSSSFNGSVERFFSELYPSTYLSHSIVRRTSKLQRIINDADALYRRLTHLKSTKRTQERFTRDGFLGLYGRRVDLLDHYEKKLEDLEDNMRMVQSSMMGKEVPAAFVSFRSRFAAAIALNIQQGINPTQWVAEPAPEPQDVYWPFFSAFFIRRWISKLVVVVACIVLTVLFLIPVFLVQGLTHLNQLESLFPFLKGILRISLISQVVTGYLPSLILHLFLSFIPPVMIVFSSMQGYIALSQIQTSACIKVLWFTIWNIFFANVLSGSALYQLNVFLEPKKIPQILAEAVPAQASFFIAYVVTSGWTTTSSELLRPFPLISSFVKRRFSGRGDKKIIAPSIRYHNDIPEILFFGLLGMTYFFLAPLILPFLLVYYCMGYIIYRNQLLNVYAPKFETGGKFWPIVHNSTIFSLVLMHIIAIGIFGLKKVPLASSLTIPLPVLTLLFNDYCRKRFRPIFQSYSAESLVNKDRSDQNDPEMADFYKNLVTAYRDPSLIPLRYWRSSDRPQRSPLLSSATV